MIMVSSAFQSRSKYLKNLIIEVGYNHMGSSYLFEKIINEISHTAEMITFQYRDLDNLPDSRWQIPYEVLLSMKSTAQNINPNLKVGLAIDSFDGMKKAEAHFDFCKILSMATNSDWAYRKTDCQKGFKYFYSLGLLTPFMLQDDHPILTDEQNSIPVFTSFDPSGEDISKREIMMLYDAFKIFGFGLHQVDSDLVKVIFDSIEIDYLFVYFSLFDSKKFNPDAEHSLTLNQIQTLADYFSKKDAFEKQSPRQQFQNFDPNK